LQQDDDNLTLTQEHRTARLWDPLRIVAIFIAVSIVWILGTDWLLQQTVANADLRAQLQTWKGMAYIALLAALLYLLIRQSRNSQQALHTEIRKQHALLETRVQEQTAELRESQGRLRLLARRLDNLRESERKRLSRELHDQLGSDLTQLKLDLETARQSGANRAADGAEPLESALARVDSLYEGLRSLAHRLRPALLDDFGLAAGIEWLAGDFRSHSGSECELMIDIDDLPADESRDTALYRICQESLTNVIKHAQARTVWVRLFTDHEGVTLIVEDDGSGIGASAPEGAARLGIVGMQERALTVGGSASVAVRREGGTRVVVNIPVHGWSAAKPPP